MRQREREAIWMCCQLAAADQWCDVKEARTRKILNESNRSVAILRGLWCGPRTKCSNVGFSSSSKIWSRIRFMETKRPLVQRNPQCAGCCIVPDISIQHQVSPFFRSSFSSSLSFMGVFITSYTQRLTHMPACTYMGLWRGQERVKCAVCIRRLTGTSLSA